MSKSKKIVRLNLVVGGFVPSQSVKKSGNPYREGTIRHKSMNLILKKPGITRDEYIKKGGSPTELVRLNHWGTVKQVNQ